MRVRLVSVRLPTGELEVLASSLLERRAYPTGAWGDRVGTRRVLTRIVVWWSAFTAVTAAAFNYASLLTIRFLFGAGEAGAFPNVAKTFSRWFPVSERGTAQGIFFAGAHLGSRGRALAWTPGGGSRVSGSGHHSVQP